jgi:hypothetical protein
MLTKVQRKEQFTILQLKLHKIEKKLENIIKNESLWFYSFWNLSYNLKSTKTYSFSLILCKNL